MEMGSGGGTDDEDLGISGDGSIHPIVPTSYPPTNGGERLTQPDAPSGSGLHLLDNKTNPAGQLTMTPVPPLITPPPPFPPIIPGNSACLGACRQCPHTPPPTKNRVRNGGCAHDDSVNVQIAVISTTPKAELRKVLNRKDVKFSEFEIFLSESFSHR